MSDCPSPEPRTAGDAPRRGGPPFELDGLTVADVMTPEVVTVRPDDLLEEVLRQITCARVHCVVVTSSDAAPLGIITERDLSWYLSWVRSGAFRTADTTRRIRARTLMQSRLVLARPGDSMATLLERARAGESPEVPVVDGDGRLVGLVTRLDLYAACSRLADRQVAREPRPRLEAPQGSAAEALLQPVSTLIRRDVIHLAPDDPIQDAIDLMAQGRISSILVTIELRPVGILTERDVTLLSSLVEKPYARARELREVMHTPLSTVHIDQSIYEASLILEKEAIRHLPVVDDKGILAGVVTQTDLLAACRSAAGADIRMLAGPMPDAARTD